MAYKKNISDKLALGYGSKYQLLRMLGWHRNYFNEGIGTLTGVSKDINWFDFEFNGPEDKELLNFDYIENLNKEWREYWVCGAAGLNWDAVGKSSDGTLILVEAKAHIKELNSSSGGSSKSKQRNNLVIEKYLKENNIDRCAEDWNKDCYQLANRLIALDFLLKRGIKAKLVYVLFVNGFEFNSSSFKSATKDQWMKAIESEFIKAGIKDNPVEKLVNIYFVDCNPKKTN